MLSILKRCLHVTVLFSYLNLLMVSTWANGIDLEEKPDYSIKVKLRDLESAAGFPKSGISVRLKHYPVPRNFERQSLAEPEDCEVIEKFIPYNFSTLAGDSYRTFQEAFTTEGYSCGFLWKIPNAMDVLVGWDGSMLATNFHNRTQTLKLSAPGSVALNDLGLKGVRIIAGSARIGQNVNLENIDVRLKDSNASFHITEKGDLAIQHLHLQQGMLVNQGKLTAKEGFSLKLYGQNLLNMGEISSPGKLRLENGGYVSNFGKINAAATHIEANYLHNHEEIGGQLLRIITYKGLENDCLIHSAEQSDILSLGLLRNRGFIRGKILQKVLAQGNLFNEGSINAPVNVLRSWKVLFNGGAVSGDTTMVEARNLQSNDNSTIAADELLNLYIHEGKIQGEITTPSLEADLKGEVINNARIETGKIILRMDESASLVNNGFIKSDNWWSQGKGTVHNKRELDIKTNAEFKNGRLVIDGLVRVAQTAVLALGERLTIGANGLLQALKAVVTGTADITIGASTQTEGQGLKVESDLDFKDYTGSFTNFGHTTVLRQTSGRIHSFLNAGTAFLMKIHDLHIVNGENRGTLKNSRIGERGLNVWGTDRFINYGEISSTFGAGAIVTVNEYFRNEGIFTAYLMKGDGLFENLGTAAGVTDGKKSYNLRIYTKKFHNIAKGERKGHFKTSLIAFSSVTDEIVNDGLIENDSSYPLIFRSKKFNNNNLVYSPAGIVFDNGELINEGSVLTKSLFSVNNATIYNMQKGFIDAQGLKFDGQYSKLYNAGTVQAQYDIEAPHLAELANTGLIQSLKGKLNLKSVLFKDIRSFGKDWKEGAFKARGDLAIARIPQEKSSFESLYAKEIISAEGKVLLEGIGSLTVFELLSAKTGSKIEASFFDFGKDILLQGSNSWKINFLNDAYTYGSQFPAHRTFAVNDFHLVGRHFASRFSLSEKISTRFLLSGKSSLLIDKISLTWPIESTGSLEIKTTKLETATIHAEKDLDIQANSIPEKDYEYISNSKLRLNLVYETDFNNQGHLQGKELEIDACTLVNSKTMIAETTLLKRAMGGFDNRANAYASLGSLYLEYNSYRTWTRDQLENGLLKDYDPNDTDNIFREIWRKDYQIATDKGEGKLINNGILLLHDLCKHEGIQAIENGKKDDQYSKPPTGPCPSPDAQPQSNNNNEPVTDYRNGYLQIKDGRFTVDTFINGGYADFSKGMCFYTRFINQQGGIFYRGHTQRFLDSFENYGNYCSNTSYTLQEGSFIKYLGKVFVKGKLTADFTPQPKAVDGPSDTPYPVGITKDDPSRLLKNTFHQSEIYCTDGIEITIPKFVTDLSFRFLSPVHFITDAFHYTGDIKAAGLHITSKEFSLGREKVYGQLSSDTTVKIEADAPDTRWGRVWGKTGLEMIARLGDIRHGARITGKPGFTYSRNDALLSTDGPFELKAENGNIFLEYGTFYARDLMNLLAREIIRNRAGLIWGRAGGRFKARTFENIREEQGTSSRQVKKLGGYWPDGFAYYDTYSVPFSFEQSDAGRIEFAKDFGDGSLVIDALQVLIIASVLNLSGPLLANGHEINPASQTYPAFFKVQARNGYPATVKSLDQICIETGNMVVTGSVAGADVSVNVEDFFGENLNNNRSQGSKKTLVFNLMEMAKAFAQQGGLFKDFGANVQGPRYGMSVPMDEPDALKREQMTLFGHLPEEKQLAQILISSLFFKWCIRTITTQLMGAKGMDEEKNLEDLLRQAREKGTDIKSYDDLYKQAKSMLVFQFQQMGQAFEQLKTPAHLIPHLVIAAEDQNPHQNDSGYMGGQKKLSLTANHDLVLQSFLAEAEDLKLHAKNMLKLQRKKITVVVPVDNGVMIKEIAAPPITLIGHHSASATAGNLYDAEGIEAFSGKGGGTYGSATGKSFTRHTTLKTDVYREIKEDGGWFGTDKIHHIHEHSEEVLPSRYVSEGPIKHLAGEGEKIRQEGTHNQSGESIEYQGASLEKKGATSHHFVDETVQKEGLFSSSNFHNHQESVGFVPSVDEAPRIIFNVTDADIQGTVIKAREVEDNTENLHLGMQKETTHSWQSEEKSNAFMQSRSWRDRDVVQESGFPSMLYVDLWKSINGQNLVFESVVGQQLKKFIVIDKNYIEKTATLKRVETMNEGSSGFCAPGMGQPVQDPLASSLKNIHHAQHTADRFEAGIKGGTESLRALTDTYKILNNLKDPFQTALERYASITFNWHQGSSRTQHIVAHPNILNFEVMYLQNEHTHLDGIHHGKQLYLLSKKITGSGFDDSLHHESHSRDASVTWTYGSFIPSSVSYHQTDHKVEQKQHHNTQVKVDQLFIRADELIFSGVKVRAKLIDAVIGNSLSLESVLSWFDEKLDSQGFSLGMSGIPDIRLQNREKKIAKIDEIAGIVGTEQFYLKVCKQLLSRSAEFGLQPDGTQVPQLRSVDGKGYYVRPMPPIDNDCGFFGLLSSRGFRNPRAAASQTLLDASDNPMVRNMIAPEIVEGLFEGAFMKLPGARALYQEYFGNTLTDDRSVVLHNPLEILDEAVRNANTALGMKGQTATDLLRLYATYKEPLGQSVIEEATSGESGKLRQLTPFVMEIQAALQAVEALEARIRTWALASSTYTSFIREYVSRPGFMLAYLREDGSGLPRTSTLDALCYLYGLRLDILVLNPQSNLLEIQHQYVPSSYDETVRLYHRATEDSLSLNHFDRLEESLESLDAGSIVHEKLDEYHHEDESVINIPLGSTMALMGQLSEAQQLMADAHHYLTDEQGLSDEQALNLINQQELKQSITDRLRQLGASEEQVQEVLNDPAIGDTIQRSDLFKKTDGGGFQVEIILGGKVYKDQTTPLEAAFDIGKRTAIALDEFAERHPTLIHLGFEALQIAMGGPTAYIRDQALKAVGVHDAVDELVHHAKDQLKHYLIQEHNFTPLHADMAADVSEFGINMGANVLGTSKPQKALQSAKNVNEKVKLSQSGRMYGKYEELVKLKAKDAHHIIQDAAVRDLSGYSRKAAPAVQLKGPAARRGTEHYAATQVQREPGGGTYLRERSRGYKSLRKAGMEKDEAKQQIRHADQYFKELGVTPETRTRIPSNRKRDNNVKL